MRRHRFFETTSNLIPRPAGTGIRSPYRVYDTEVVLSGVVAVYGTGGGKGAEHWADAMGIGWMSRPELARPFRPRTRSTSFARYSAVRMRATGASR